MTSGSGILVIFLTILDIVVRNVAMSAPFEGGGWKFDDQGAIKVAVGAPLPLPQPFHQLDWLFVVLYRHVDAVVVYKLAASMSYSYC